ncbi:MAG: MCE family protein [Alphaproteobacteria bacterium]|nr:MCE family protein [Alphaproteobacteria bacterium SS10]
MENQSNDVLVGGFVVLFVGLALTFIAWLTNADLEGNAQRYRVYLDRSVTGLQVGSPVRLLGVPVGQVTEVGIDPETLTRVRVYIEVDADTPIRTDSEARLDQQGLTGGIFVEVSPGTSDSPLLRIASQDEVPEITARGSQFSELLEAAPELLNNLIGLTERAAMVFSDDNIISLSKSIQEIEVILTSIAQAGARMDPMLTKVDGILDQTATTLETFNELGENTGQSISNIETATIEVFDSFTTTSQAVFDASTTTQSMVERADTILESNSDSLGDFTSNGLYELTFLFQELRGLVSNLSLLAERIERAPTEFLFGTTADGVELE